MGNTKAARDDAEQARDDSDLWSRLQSGDGQARDALIRHHLPLVHHVLRRFRSTSADPAELEQVGSIGLIKAVDGFDPSRGLRFSTYAVPVITGEILRYLRDDRPVHTSRRAYALSHRAADMQTRLAQRLGREPTVSELAAALEVDVGELAAAIEAVRRPASVDEPLSGDDEDPVRLLDRLSDGDRVAELAAARALLAGLLAGLDPRARRILLLRYFEDRTQQEIAAQVGLSQGQVSRLERRAIAELRRVAGERASS